MEKLKILIIPSWYPNEKDPLWGNYFIKQAEALNEYADVSMLYINRIGLKEIKKLSKEKLTDGYNDELYTFKFYKKTILNYKSLSIDYAYNKYKKAAYSAYKKLEIFIGKPDIIIAESILPAAIAAKYIKEKTNIPYIVHAHSENVMSNPMYTKQIKDLVANADNYMAVNNRIKEVVLKNGRKECKLVPNFIDCNRFNMKKSKKSKDFVLVSVCNFYKVKALDVLLRALDIVVNKNGNKDVKLKIIGTGEYKDYYESISRSLKLNNNVEFVGYVDNNELPNILNSSNAENQKDISGYINEFIQTIKNNEYQIDTKKLLINSIMSNLKLAVIIWISGSTIIGIPLVYGCLGYKGICIGYSISAIIAVLEKGKGIIFAISSMLLQNIIAIPCILALTVSSIKMYKSTMKERNKENIKYEIYRHTMFSLFMAIGLIISSVIEVFVTTNITNNIIINFI